MSFLSRLIVMSLIGHCLTVQASIEGALTGKVVTLYGVAMPDVTVQLKNRENGATYSTRTAEHGDYQFLGVPFGKYEVLVPGKVNLTDIQVSSGSNTVVPELVVQSSSDPELVPREMVVEVTAKKTLISKSTSVSKTFIDQNQVKQLPQGSEITLPKLLSSTGPGVVAGPFGQLFFRGNHATVQYQIDGVQMPESQSSSFGPAFSPRNIDSMEVITGGMPAEYGQRLSAVVNIVTKSGPETPHGEVEMNYGSYDSFSPHLLYGGSNQEGDFHYFVSLNYNQTRRGLDTPQPVDTTPEGQKQGGTDSVHNFSSGDTEFVKLQWQLDNENKLTWIAFNSAVKYQVPNFPSSFSHNLPYFQPGFVDVFGNVGELHHGHQHVTFNYAPSNTNDFQREMNTYTQVIWKHIFSERSFLQIAPYYKYSSIVFHGDPVNDLASTGDGSIPISGSESTSFSENRHVNNLGLKSDYTVRVTDDHLLKTGFQVQVSRADGYYSFQKSLVSPAASQSTPDTGYMEGLYVQDDYTLNQSVNFNVGLRFDATQYRFSDTQTSDWLLQPRIGMNYLLTEATKFHVFYGKLFQPSPIENLRASFSLADPKNIVPYDIKAEKDDYYEMGVAQQLGDTQVVQLNVYYKDATNMLDAAQLLQTPLTQPYNFAKGYAYGTELSIRGQITPEVSEFVNYSYTIAKGKQISGGIWALDEIPSTNGYQFLDHLQVHTANAGLTYTRNSYWVTGQGVFGSGLRTGPDKQATLPAHFTMDTTVGYEFNSTSWLSQFRVSLDVLNVFDNRYPVTIADGYNTTAYAAGRMFYIRLAKLF